MTRAEAIKILNASDYFWLRPSENEAEALNMAIDALEQIESGRYVKGECRMCSKEYGTLGCCTTVSNHWVYSCKEGMTQYNAPSVATGKWIAIDDTHSQCTECGAIFCITSSDEWEVKYCPNCGAIMGGEE